MFVFRLPWAYEPRAADGFYIRQISLVQGKFLDSGRPNLSVFLERTQYGTDGEELVDSR
jgi:hypothetical protein